MILIAYATKRNLKLGVMSLSPISLSEQEKA